MALPAERARKGELLKRLRSYKETPLPGIATDVALSVLVDQMIDSLRRVDYVHHIRDAKHHERRKDPHDVLFDPLKAAALYQRQGNIEEANWLVFLATHFGKHSADGWRLAKDIYGSFGVGPVWHWPAVQDDAQAFDAWFATQYHASSADGITRRFSSHRQYQSHKRTPQVFRSFVAWTNANGGIPGLITAANRRVGQDPTLVFDFGYRAMTPVYQFGRLGIFDYLTMLGKLGMAPIVPGSPYLKGATGPLRGARLLFTGSSEGPRSASKLDAQLVKLDDWLEVGKQVLEDSLCNWQKSPNHYELFRG
jgi:hypothetical protein